MRVSPTSDAGLELDLATDSAHALLESLAIRPDDVGEIPVDAIRARLSNPAVRQRADAEGTTRYLDQLNRLVSYADTDSATRLEWA